MLPRSSALGRFSALLFLFFWLAVATGCGPKPSEIVRLGETHGLRRAYENVFCFERPPEEVFGALSHVLNEDSNVITACDERRGLLAWCDRSGVFHPLASTHRPRTKAPVQQDLLSFHIERFHGVVYAAARLKTRGNGTVLALHASRRDEDPWVLEYSNGDYERHIYRRIQNWFVRREVER